MEQINTTHSEPEMGITPMEFHNDNYQKKLTGTLDLIKHAISTFKAKKKNLIPVLAINVVATFIYFLATSSANIIGFLILPVIFILYLIITLANSYALAKIVLDEENLDWKIAIKLGLKKITSLSWVAFLVGFITLGGFVFFLVPGIIFMIILSFAQLAFIHHDMRSTKALAYSIHLTKNRFWAIAGRGLLLLIIFFGCIIASGIVFGIVAVPISLISPTIGVNIIQLANMAISSFFGVFILISLAKIYRELDTLRASSFTGQRKTLAKLMILSGLGWLLVPIIVIALISYGLGIGEFNKDNILNDPMMRDNQAGDMLQQLKGRLDAGEIQIQ